MNADNNLIRQNLLNMKMGKINRWIIIYYLKFREGILSIHQLNGHHSDFIHFITSNARKYCDYFLLGYIVAPMAKKDGQKAAEIFQVKHSTIIYISSFIVTPLFCFLGHTLYKKISLLFGLPQNNGNIFSIISHGISGFWQLLAYSKPLIGLIWNGLLRSSICRFSNGEKIMVPFSLQAIVQNYDVYIRYWKGVFKKLKPVL